MWWFFCKGVGIGIAIAAPVGPIGILCMQRTLMFGSTAGLAAGLGAATADALYGTLAAFGLGTAVAFLQGHEFWFRLVGGLFLCVLGWRIMRSRPVDAAHHKAEEVGRPERGGHILFGYLSVLALTLANPMTIFSFAAIFAGLGLGDTGGDHNAAAILVAGVFSGSALWWLFLSVAAGLLRARLSPFLRRLNLASGLVVMGFGLGALIGAFV